MTTTMDMMLPQLEHMPTTRRSFPRRATAARRARRRRRVRSRIAPVAKQIGDATVRMLAYNGSVPGPTLRVRAGLDGRP